MNLKKKNNPLKLTPSFAKTLSLMFLYRPTTEEGRLKRRAAGRREGVANSNISPNFSETLLPLNDKFTTQYSRTQALKSENLGRNLDCNLCMCDLRGQDTYSDSVSSSKK